MGKTELGQHIIWRAEDSRVLAPTVADRRRLARAVLQIGRPYRLLAFNSPDTHLHAGAVCSREDAGEFARRLQIALAQRHDLRAPFAPAHYTEIRDQRHLQHAFFYILRQREHHGCNEDPYHEASNLPDLLGLRTVGTYTAENVRAFVPRVLRADLLEVLGVPSLQPEAAPAPGDLAAAAAAAAGLAALAGRSREVIAARCAAVHAAGRRFTAAELATALGCGQRTIKRLRAAVPSDVLVKAVLLQVRLRAARPSEDHGLVPRAS